MKTVIVLLVSIILLSCVSTDELKSARKKSRYESELSYIKEYCYDGVPYLVYTSFRAGGMTVKLNTDGSIANCN